MLMHLLWVNSCLLDVMLLFNGLVQDLYLLFGLEVTVLVKLISEISITPSCLVAVALRSWYAWNCMWWLLLNEGMMGIDTRGGKRVHVVNKILG